MQLDIVVVMDPIDRINTTKDTTFAMLLEGQRRGHRLHYVRPGGLFLRDGEAGAVAAPLQVRDAATDWFSLGDYAELPLGPGQAVLMRTDPPVDADYLHDTQLLDFARLAVFFRQGADLAISAMYFCGGAIGMHGDIGQRVQFIDQDRIGFERGHEFDYIHMLDHASQINRRFHA